MAYKKNYTAKSAKEKKAELDNLMGKLEAGVADVFASGKLTDWLNIMSKFPRYSANNCLLIMMQRPTAQHVCGYVTWDKEFNRHVIKGEKAIKILGGRLCKGTRKVEDEDGNMVEEEFSYTRFFPCSVFADDQTEGDPIPELCKELSGEASGYATIKAKLEGISNFPIAFEDITDGSNGYFSPVEQKIAIKSGMSESQTIKTMVHELTHSILHCDGGEQEKADRDTKEIQAESVAYVVCNHLGIESAEYSFPYLASWSKGKQARAIQDNMEIIRKTAAHLIDCLTAEKKEEKEDVA